MSAEQTGDRLDGIEEQPCGCVVQHVEAGEIVAQFCAEHLIVKDPFGPIPREM